MAENLTPFDVVLESPRFQRDLQQTPEVELSRAGLSLMLAELKGATFATFDLVTTPKMNKTHRETREPNPYLGRVEKRSRVNVCLCANYENAVNRQREREALPGSFAAQAHAWAHHIGGAVVEHQTSGKHYAAVKVEHWYESALMVDGRMVEPAELAPYLPPPSKSGANQGVEKPVQWRTFALDSIHAMKLNGVRYRIVD